MLISTVKHSNLVLLVSGFLALVRVLWAQQQSRVHSHQSQAFKGIFDKKYTWVFPCLSCIAFWKSTSVLFCLYVSQALIFMVEFNISLPILLPSCQIEFQVTAATCLSWSKWQRDLCSQAFLATCQEQTLSCVAYNNMICCMDGICLKKGELQSC